MIFALRHNAPAAPSAQAPNPIVSVMFAPLPVLPIPNAPPLRRIVTAALAEQIKLAPLTLNAPVAHLIAPATFAPPLLPQGQRCINLLPPEVLILFLWQGGIRYKWQQVAL